MNPIPRAVSASATPKPARSNSAVWISRRCRVVKLTSATSGTTIITNGDIAAALQVNGAEIATFRVDGIKCWNVSSPALTSNFIRVLPDDGLFTSTGATVTSLTGPYEDYGGGSSIARVGVNFPDLLLTSQSSTISSSTPAFTLLADPTSRTSGLSIQTLVCDIVVRVQF